MSAGNLGMAFNVVKFPQLNLSPPDFINLYLVHYYPLCT